MGAHSNQKDVLSDFGNQWTMFTENRGYYASLQALDSLIQPLLAVKSLQNKWIADVGAGTGRYTRLLHEAGAKAILAMEPSDAFEVLKRNTTGLREIEYLKAPAERTPLLGFDFIFCIGVLQFIEDPRSALVAMGRALKPGGELFLWVYGKEKNGLYLALLNFLRMFSSRLPPKLLNAFSCWLLPLADLYAFGCRILKLPLSDYLLNYFSRLDFYTRKLIIYDQLNPRIAKYYRAAELRALLKGCGFENIRMYHRLGYSWSVLASFQRGDSGDSP